MGHFKLKGEHVYSAINAFTGISRDHIEAALNGDPSAADVVLKYAEHQQAQAANAETIYTALQDGVAANSKLVQLEAKFLTGAASQLVGVQKAVNSLESADARYRNTTVELARKHGNAIASETQRHRRTISLIDAEYQIDQKVADLQERSHRVALRQQIDQAEQQLSAATQVLSPRQKAIAQLERVQNVSGQVGQSLGGVFGKVFRGLFG